MRQRPEVGDDDDVDYLTVDASRRLVHDDVGDHGGDDDDDNET